MAARLAVVENERQRESLWTNKIESMWLALDAASLDTCGGIIHNHYLTNAR